MRNTFSGGQIGAARVSKSSPKVARSTSSAVPGVLKVESETYKAYDHFGKDKFELDILHTID